MALNEIPLVILLFGSFIICSEFREILKCSFFHWHTGHKNGNKSIFGWKNKRKIIISPRRRIELNYVIANIRTSMVENHLTYQHNQTMLCRNYVIYVRIVWMTQSYKTKCDNADGIDGMLQHLSYALCNIRFHLRMQNVSFAHFTHLYSHT